jgi:hypothetical protein
MIFKKKEFIFNLFLSLQVNSVFRDIIDDCSTVWNAASFQDTWPSANNIQYFEK